MILISRFHKKNEACTGIPLEKMKISGLAGKIRLNRLVSASALFSIFLYFLVPVKHMASGLSGTGLNVIPYQEKERTAVFDICEYGTRPGSEEISWLFPMIETNEIKKNSSYTYREEVLRIKHTKDFNITGDGHAINWNNIEWLALPQRNSMSVVYQTKIKVLYSDSGIYCLYRCEDIKITATLKEDFLDLYNEDVVEAFFRTDEKVPMYFEYELSPLNYELPILVPNIKGNFFGWRPWHYEGSRRTRHATHISKEGEVVTAWTAEFFIPYALLKPLTNVPPQKGSRWRANFYRIDYDEDTVTWQWQLVQNENFHDYERFGAIVFD